MLYVGTTTTMNVQLFVQPKGIKIRGAYVGLGKAGLNTFHSIS